MNTNETISKIMRIIKINRLEILKVETDEMKLSIVFNGKISDNILEQIHNEIIE